MPDQASGVIYRGQAPQKAGPIMNASQDFDYPDTVDAEAPAKEDRRIALVRNLVAAEYRAEMMAHRADSAAKEAKVAKEDLRSVRAELSEALGFSGKENVLAKVAGFEDFR